MVNTNIWDINIIENLEEITNIKNPDLIIHFPTNSEIIFNHFISKHPNQKFNYIKPNHQVGIDIIEYDFDFYIYFIDCIEKAQQYISNSKYYKLKLFDDINEWNFCIFQNVMFNFPFTLENIIYFPIDYIKENYINQNYKNIIRTIIHEKLHISQRFNEQIWTNFINIQDKNWIKITKSDNLFIIIENNIKYNKILEYYEEFITNPDSFYNGFKYLYKINNELYYGHYVINKNTSNIYIKYFQIDTKNNQLVPTNIKFEQEHPYETFAYKISEEII